MISKQELSITLVQTALAWEAPAKNLKHFDMLLGRIESDLIVLPEMFSTGFSMSSAELAESMNGPTIEWMQKKAISLNTIVCGSLIIKENGKYFNRFIWMPASGDVSFYDKRHLFRMSAENDHYTSGKGRLVLELNGFRICPQVCYDLRFPVWTRNNGAYDLLLYVANWPAARREHWRSLLKARAIENLCYVVGVNRIGTDGNNIEYSGDSVVHDFNGAAIQEAGSADAVKTVSLNKDSLIEYRAKFPAHLDADNYKIDP